MYLDTVIARFGLDSELDSTLFCSIEEAEKNDKLWLDNEDCDSVDIYYEESDWKTGTFRTKNKVLHLKKD